MVDFFKNLFKKQKHPYWETEHYPQLLNEKLQDAINAFTKEDNLKNREHLYGILITLSYYMSTDGTSNYAILTMENDRGELILPAFSDQPAMYRWNPDNKYYMVMTAQQLFESVMENEFTAIALNPAGPAGTTVPRVIVRHLLHSLTT